MELFTALFGKLLVLVYHCFDRIVIQGYLPLLVREEHVVHFFRDVQKIYPITKEALSKRTNEYKRWVEAFARKQRIPMEWAQKGVRKEDYVRPHLERMQRQNRHGVYFILQSMEQGYSFQSRLPQYPTEDPGYRVIRKRPSRFTHLYFYIRDEILGPMVMCVGTFLPFQTTYYTNGHHFMEGELRRQGIRFRKDDNAFLSASDPQALQAAADHLSAEVIRKRLDLWTWVLGPKFSAKERAAINLRRAYSINQVEYCRNFVFSRHFPIHRIFERSCELGLFALSADKVAQIFGTRITRKVRGKVSSLLDRLDHGHHVLRVYCKSLVARMYEKFSTFLRLEICVNRLKDLGLNKGLDNLEALRAKLAAATDRFAGFEAQSLNVHVDFPLFQRLALPITSGRSKIPGIKIHDTPMVRMMEVLLHGGTPLHGWTSAPLRQAILTTFGLSSYTIDQVRQDLRK